MVDAAGDAAHEVTADASPASTINPYRRCMHPSWTGNTTVELRRPQRRPVTRPPFLNARCRSSSAVIRVYGGGMTQKTGAGLLLMTLFVVGCANGGGASPSSPAEATAQQSPSAMASANRAIGCLAAPPDVEALIEFQDGTRDDPAGCFGDVPLTFDASWTGGGVADCPMAPEPAWLACSAFSLGTGWRDAQGGCAVTVRRRGSEPESTTGRGRPTSASPVTSTTPPPRPATRRCSVARPNRSRRQPTRLSSVGAYW